MLVPARAGCWGVYTITCSINTCGDNVEVSANPPSLSLYCTPPLVSPCACRLPSWPSQAASLLDVLCPAEPQATVDLPQLELLPHGDRDEWHRLDDDLAHENRRALLV